MEAHGGKLWARVNGDAGATFVCLLPAVLSTSLIPSCSSSTTIRRSAAPPSAFCGLAGHEVHSFASARELLLSSRPDMPACLVTDVRDAGTEWPDLQNELARVGWQIPIIFITGHGDVPTSVRAMKAGATEFLTKPFCERNSSRP